MKEGGIDKETLIRCFDSICDADSYIMFNRVCSLFWIYLYLYHKYVDMFLGPYILF